jgi:hypothetical protein
MSGLLIFNRFDGLFAAQAYETANQSEAFEHFGRLLHPVGFITLGSAAQAEPLRVASVGVPADGRKPHVQGTCSS